MQAVDDKLQVEAERKWATTNVESAIAFPSPPPALPKNAKFWTTEQYSLDGHNWIDHESSFIGQIRVAARTLSNGRQKFLNPLAADASLGELSFLSKSSLDCKVWGMEDVLVAAEGDRKLHIFIGLIKQTFSLNLVKRYGPLLVRAWRIQYTEINREYFILRVDPKYSVVIALSTSNTLSTSAYQASTILHDEGFACVHPKGNIGIYSGSFQVLSLQQKLVDMQQLDKNAVYQCLLPYLPPSKAAWAYTVQFYVWGFCVVPHSVEILGRGPCSSGCCRPGTSGIQTSPGCWGRASRSMSYRPKKLLPPSNCFAAEATDAQKPFMLPPFTPVNTIAVWHLPPNVYVYVGFVFPRNFPFEKTLVCGRDYQVYIRRVDETEMETHIWVEEGHYMIPFSYDLRENKANRIAPKFYRLNVHIGFSESDKTIPRGQRHLIKWRINTVIHGQMQNSCVKKSDEEASVILGSDYIASFNAETGLYFAHTHTQNHTSDLVIMKEKVEKTATIVEERSL